jgi:predicted dehydrogenase
MGRNLARNLGAVPRARLARVCDAVEDAARGAGEQLGVPWTTDVHDLLGDPAIGAVIVATPNFTHAEMVASAAAAGKHIFCEKPMALSVADCDRMIAAARRHRVHLCLGHVLRYLPVFDTIKRLITEGVIGEPFAMRVSRLGGWGESQPWRQKRELCGGPLFEVNVHELDYMRYVLGEPEIVYATGSQAVVRQTDFEDTAFVSIRFAGGGHGVLHTSTAAALGGYNGIVQGSRGTLAFTNWPSRIEYKTFGGQMETLGADQIGAPEEPHQRELRHLVEAALDGTPPVIAGEDGRSAVAMAEAAVRSMQTGRPVAVAELLTGAGR